MSDIRKELAKLSSESVARIWDALHDLKDGALHNACQAIVWDRHATMGEEWPTSNADIGPISLVVEGIEHEWQPGIRSHRVRSYCRTVRGTKPDDPAHKVARVLDWSYVDVQGRERRFSDMECSCGASGDRMHLGVVRCTSEANVWPVATIPGVNNGHPVFVVCKYAEHAQDPMHAPSGSGERCICGGSLGKWNEWADTPATDKYLPVQ
jgi:hypothetical protein